MTGRTALTPGATASPRDPLAELLLRAGRGDEDAFAEIYRTAASRVYGISLRVLRDPHQAEEAAQEAFVEIWRHAGRFDPDRGSAIGWMLTLTHRRAVDRVRSSAAGRRRDNTWHRAADHTTTLDATFDLARANLNARVIRSALTCLSAVQRRAVELAYFEGHTYPEVAHLMQAPLGTTKTRMRTALLLLREQVEIVTAVTA